MRTFQYIMTGLTAALPTALLAQSGSSANAVAGALCCTVLQGPDADGSPHLTPDAASRAAASYVGDGVGISHDVLANASAYADLATGKIGALGITSDYGYSSATAQIADVLRFAIAGASASTVTPIVFAIRYHGTIQPSYGGVGTQMNLHVQQDLANGQYGGTGGAGVSRYKGLGNAQLEFYDRVQNSGWLEFAAVPDATGDTYMIRAVFGLIGAAPTLKVSQYLNLSTSHAAHADFSHTAALSMTLPDQVSYTSASGIFLSQVAAVPEPSSWALMLGGFSLLGGMLRRARGRGRPGCVAV